jgi:large subunit ribosomal protein L24
MNKKLNSHVKIGDKVKVITGSQKGFIGIINSIIIKKSVVIVDGILPRIKYIKNRQGGDPLKKEIPIYIHISNIMLWDKEANKASKIGYKIIDNKKVRYFKKSGNVVT